MLGAIAFVAALIAAGGGPLSITVSSSEASATDSFGLGIILMLLSSALGSFGTMFFLAGLIGLAVNGGAEEPVVGRVLTLGSARSAASARTRWAPSTVGTAGPSW